MQEILVKNGLVINSDEKFESDILIKGNKIAKVGRNIASNSAKIIQAKNKYIIPGGIDPHVHMHLQTPFGFSADNFVTGSKAALHVGTTTIIDFITPKRGESLISALEKRKLEAKDSLCNTLFHLSIVDWHEGIEEEIIYCIEKKNIRSFKVYMAYQSSIGINDEILEKVLHFLSDKNVLVLIHCEIDKIITERQKKLLSERKNTAKYHPESRPAEAEIEAVKRVISLSGKTNCPVYIVHVSTAGAATEIDKAKKSGIQINAETCPQYLLLNESVYDNTNKLAVNYVMSPPLRAWTDQVTLWNGLANENIDTIATDHCPFTTQQKYNGLDDFTKIPNGAGGVEFRLELLHRFGVNERKINLQQWVKLISFNAAQIFKLTDRGRIKEGYKADITIFDPLKTKTLSVKNQLQNCDFNIYESIKLKGAVEAVIFNGNIL